MFTVRLLSIGAMILLAGCAHGPVDESADFAPVNYRDVCLLENSAVRSTRLVDAIESGFRAAKLALVKHRVQVGVFGAVRSDTLAIFKQFFDVDILCYVVSEISCLIGTDNNSIIGI